ncbi:MAG TPA: hypothetical protein VFF84_07350 [Sphingobium sp.]|nr:hypothetical protein [Sphingobium sp.]
MARTPREDGAWFLPKRYGYGAGLPIAWQGWVVLGAYGAVVALFVWLVQRPGAAPQIGAVVLLMVATLVLVAVSRRRTRGGWRWRWSKKD